MTTSEPSENGEDFDDAEAAAVAARLGDDAHALLAHIQAGRADTQQITAASTFENHQVRRLFRTLADAGLVTVDKPEGMVERWVDGQRRVFQAPLRAELTAQGEAVLAAGPTTAAAVETMSRAELIEAYHTLCERVADLEVALDVFRDQVRRQLD